MFVIVQASKPIQTPASEALYPLIGGTVTGREVLCTVLIVRNAGAFVVHKFVYFYIQINHLGRSIRPRIFSVLLP